MTKRLACIVLILALGGSVLAGMPMHSGGADSGMMDCCKHALEQNGSPRVAAARLCCAMNCSEPGSTSSNTSPTFSQTASEPGPLIVANLSTRSDLKALRAHSKATTSASLKPAYILNLALLI